MGRLLGTVVGLTVLFGLTGCSNDDEDRQRISDAEAAIDAARAGVAHQIADELGWEFSTGNRRYVDCGGSYASDGVKVEDNINLLPATFDTADMDEVARVIEDDGWEVERPRNPLIVEGTKGVVLLRVSGGVAMVNVQIGMECIDTSGDLARELGGRSSVDIEWDGS